MTFPINAYSVPVIYLKFFKKIVLNYDSKYHLTLKQFRNIIYLFNKKFSKALLEGKIFDLPYKLGQFRIKKKELNIKTAKLNIQEFMKSGLKTRHYNEHSEGFNARFFWEKTSCQVMGSYMFSFTPTQTNKRELTKIMKTRGEHKRFFK